MTWEDESPQVGRCPICYWRRVGEHCAKVETMLSYHVSSGESKVRCCKEQYCIGTWNVS